MPKTAKKELTLCNAFEAAARHGKNSDPDHEVGDLQDMLRVAYSIMGTASQDLFLHSQAVEGLIEQEL